ncbi:MAG: YraN family protein [Clostridia bacterium]|nr:YraN family protein [Clostridia bacterium]
MSAYPNSPADRRGIGRFCESAVADYLTARGYTIVARGFTVKGGEIDLIAEDGATLLFVEVKGRTDGDQIRRFGRPATAVNAAKREHLLFAAREYIRRTGNAKKPRLDVAEVYMTSVEAITDTSEQWTALTIRYYPAAFRG